MVVVALSQLAAAVMLNAGVSAGDVVPLLRLVPVQAQQQGGETPDASLAGTEWLLKSLRGVDVDPEIGSSLSFDGEGNVSGNGGCNRFRGDVAIEEQTLKFGDLASTRMACEEAKSRQEADYHAAMADTVTFRIEQGELTLLDEQEEVVARLTSAQ